MGGKGWGGKGTSSLTYEQLQGMGIGRGEGPGPTLAPPPLYPKMENPPLPLCMDASMDYMLILKKQFIDFLHDSPSFVQPVAVKADVERYSDKYKVLSTVGKDNKSSDYSWSDMPRELRPAQDLKALKGIKRKAQKQVDLASKLNKLEELEKSTKKEDDEKTDAAGNDKNSSDEEERDSEKEDVEDPDEEMDDGTDYVDNYFDNGEAFDDEDDNMDDGPVY